MKTEELYSVTLDYLEKSCPALNTVLEHDTPFHLLVAVVLSAQCTDERVNLTTPALFKKYPTSKVMAETKATDILKFIHSVSYPNSKAKYLVGLAQMLEEKFNGKIPSTLEELTLLPGVGRKTANVIQAIVFHKAAIAVDTHVFRVSHRIGLVKDSDKTPLSVEKTLTQHIAEKKRANAHFWLLYHGRYICTARNPHCDKCALPPYCKFFKNKEKIISKK